VGSVGGVDVVRLDAELHVAMRLIGFASRIPEPSTYRARFARLDRKSVGTQKEGSDRERAPLQRYQRLSDPFWRRHVGIAVSISIWARLRLGAQLQRQENCVG